MATDKKSFLLYCDLIHTVSKMPKEKAGELFMHILQYVNDENPITDDLIIQLTFEPIKQSLKRDLAKWEGKSDQRVEKARAAGLASGQARKLKAELNSTNELKVELNPTKPTVSVSVSVSDSVKEIINNNDRFFSDLLNSESWLERTAMQSSQKFTIQEIKTFLKKYTEMINVQFEIKNNKTEYCTHFINWLNKQIKVNGVTKKSNLL
jgi:hypothetical protein